ncbi:sacsin N-terminal ATP-binding-like domain-containing protein [Spirillospora sp. NPDC127200]
MDEPFGAGALRSRVLRAWAESPARFREDANAEEDYALGGYRDRVVIELAQNAADAAARAGEAGRLRLAFDGATGVLTAANTGAALDAAGVEALSTLRASSKRDEAGAAGRFGVGFAAVVAVSDDPSIESADGGVAWSAERTRALVAEIPGLAGELGRRDGQVPLLRLPFGLDRAPEVPDGYATAVRLPLRDAAAAESVRRQLDEAGPALMLALPALGVVEIDIDGDVRVLTAEHGPGRVTVNGLDWRVAEAGGALPPELLADRPTEERSRSTWQVRWAVSAESAPGVLHAPTPSDEPVSLPALLIASFPLAPDRRHVAPGPLTDFLVERAADAYVELMRDAPPAPALLDLVPTSLAKGELDARLRRAVLERLPDTPLLPLDGEHRARGRDTVAVDGPAGFVELLAESAMPGLLPPGWPARHPALTPLGVRRMELADVVDALAGLDRDPAWWRALYASLDGAPTDALGALPVPLAGGRLVRGPRGLLVAGDGVDPAGLDALGLRFVHPEAVHRLLLRLGAIEAGPRDVLADPAVRAAVEGSLDAGEPAEIAEAVLGLVAATSLDPGEEPWLADLALPGEDGELYPAGELLLPGGPLGRIMAEDAPFGVADAGLVERWGAETLTGAGVLDDFAAVRVESINLDALADGVDPLHLDDEDRWAEAVLERLGAQEMPPLVLEFQGVRDLELVADWDAALRSLAGPRHRAAVVEPAQVLLVDGTRTLVPSYTAWWLRRHPVLAGRRPGEFRLPGAPGDLLAGLYERAPEGLDERLLLALGVRTDLDGLLGEPGGAQELLDRMGDPVRSLTRAQLGELWTALAELPDPAVRPPERVRAIVDGEVEVVDAADALVLDRPDLLPLLAGQPLVIAAHGHAAELAELLDLPVASEEVPGRVESAGAERPVPDAVRAVLPDAPDAYVAHEELIVDGQAVPWWSDGGPHASGPEGLARALAWEAGRWADRLLVEAVLRAPESLPDLLAETDLEL